MSQIYRGRPVGAIQLYVQCNLVHAGHGIHTESHTNARTLRVSKYQPTVDIMASPDVTWPAGGFNINNPRFSFSVGKQKKPHAKTINRTCIPCRRTIKIYRGSYTRSASFALSRNVDRSSCYWPVPEERRPRSPASRVAAAPRPPGWERALRSGARNSPSWASALRGPSAGTSTRQAQVAQT